MPDRLLYHGGMFFSKENNSIHVDSLFSEKCALWHRRKKGACLADKERLMFSCILTRVLPVMPALKKGILSLIPVGGASG